MGHPIFHTINHIWVYLRNNLSFWKVCREITAEGFFTNWGSFAAEGGYQISPRRLFHAQTLAQIIQIIKYWASNVNMF